MRYLLSLVVISMIAFTSMTCHSPTGPSNVSDTTSHAFSFQEFTFGGASASALYDIAIVSDTNIWAVGEIYLDSANGNLDPFPYNAVHYDGKDWSVMRIPYLYQLQPLYHAIIGVFALSADDVWFGGNGLEHWDGSRFSNVEAVNPFWSGRLMYKIWASSDNDIYILGSGGTVVHYSNGSWSQVKSGTSLNFCDIFGCGGQVLAVASNPYAGYDREIVQLNGTAATSLSDDGISWPLSSIWFVAGHYYVVGQGIYEKTSLSDPVWRRDSVDTTDYKFSIRGNAWNDIFVAGSFLMHYNGKDWKSYKDETTLPLSGGYSKVAMRNDLVIAVGSDGGKAVAVVGRR